MLARLWLLGVRRPQMGAEGGGTQCDYRVWQCWTRRLLVAGGSIEDLTCLSHAARGTTPDSCQASRQAPWTAGCTRIRISRNTSIPPVSSPAARPGRIATLQFSNPRLRQRLSIRAIQHIAKSRTVDQIFLERADSDPSRNPHFTSIRLAAEAPYKSQKLVTTDDMECAKTHGFWNVL